MERNESAGRRRQLLGLAVGLVALAQGPAKAGPSTEALIQRAIEAPTLSSLSVSPDGRWAVVRQERALVAENRVLAEWVLCDLPAGHCRTIADAGQVHVSTSGTVLGETIVWRPDSAAFFFRRREPGRHTTIWRFDLSTAQASEWRRTSGEVRQLASLGDRMLVVEGPAPREIEAADEALRRQGVRIESGTYARAPLMTSQLVDGRWRPAVQTRFGPRDYRWISPAETERRYSLAIGDGAPQERAEGPLPNAAAPTSRWGSADVESLNEGGGGVRPQRRLRVTRGSKVHLCPAVECRGDSLVIDGWLGREVIFRTRDVTDGASLHAWRPGASRVRTLWTGTGALFGGERLADEGRCAVLAQSVLCLAEDPLQSARLEEIRADGARRTIYRPKGAIEGVEDAAVRRITWASMNGRTAGGVLLTPASVTGRIPLVVTSYRCRTFMDGAFHRVPEVVGPSSGVAVLCVAASNQLWRGSRPAEGHVAFLEDMRAGVEKLVADGLVDPDRVAISGISFSAESVLLGVTHGKGFAAAIAGGPTYLDAPFAPGFDLLGNEYSQWATELRNLPPYDENPAPWRALAPSQRADKLSTPLLMNTPESEFRSALPLFYGALRKGRPFELFAYPDETHLFYEPAHRFTSAVRSWDWIRFWLQEVEDSRLEKRDQNTRWRAMRSKQNSGSP